MHKFDHICQTPYQVDDIIAIILDIDSYPEFLPWCTGARVIERHENMLLADLVISFKGLTESYRSEVHFTRNEKEAIVDVQAISGPFKTLTNKWRVRPTKQGCSIEFELQFELGVGILSKLLSPLFAKACDRMLVAFEQRARKVLGEE